jgi:hypothetical protein
MQKPLPDLLRQRIDAIADVAQAWLNPTSKWMSWATKEIPKLSSFSCEMVRECLRNTFSKYHVEELTEWVRKDRLNGTKFSDREVCIILPSTVFAAAWQSAVAVWLAGFKVVLKPSRREPAFAKMLTQSIQEISKGILPIRVATSKNEDAPFLAVIAYGKDETITKIRQSTKVPVIGFGTKISISIIEQKTWKFLGNKIAKNAAYDVMLYNSQGCLTPQCFFVKTEIAEDFAKRVAAALKKTEQRFPLKISEHELFEAESFWQKWKFLESQGRATIFNSQLILTSEDFEPSGLKRVVFVKPVRSFNEITRCLGPWRKKISTIALSDFSFEKQIRKAFKQIREIRICHIGKMHAPSPSWQNGGINLLRKLSSKL